MLNSQTNPESKKIKPVLEEKKKTNEIHSGEFNFSTNHSSTINDLTLPSIKKEVPLTVSVYSITTAFSKSCKKFKFLITEQTPSACTAYYTQTCSITSLFLCCFGKKAKIRTSSLRLILSIDPRSASRLIHIKSQQGDCYLLNKVISHFLSALESEILKYTNLQYQKVTEEDEEEELAITCKYESYSYYQFYKILSCEAYTLGKSISEFCDSFISQYRNPAESANLIPQPLVSIQGIVETTIESLFSHYNYGKKNNEKIMVYCRPAVEKYIYTKLNTNLMNIYKAKFEEQDKIIETEREKLKNNENIFQELNVPDKLRFAGGFLDAAECLCKINEMVTPAEKLNCIFNFESSIKSEVVSQWRGQDELDDENCVLIEVYCVIISGVRNVRAEVGLISDYLSDKTDEGKLTILNIEKALSYLTRE